MKTKTSNKSRKSVARRRQRAAAASNELQRRAWVDAREWQIVTFGMRDPEIAQALRVSPATVGRWRRGEARIPWMAFEIMRQRKGMSLPGAYREFEDFLLMRANHGLVLVPPGAHWKDGITARDVKNWWMLRKIVQRALVKNPELTHISVPASHLLKPASNESRVPIADVIPLPV